MAHRPLIEIAYEGILWKQSYWIKNWRKRWCILTVSGSLFCFKERFNYTFHGQTEVFELREFGAGDAFTQIRLLHNDSQELIFELIRPKDKMTRKFRIMDKEYMSFFQRIKDIMNNEAKYGNYGFHIPTNETTTKQFTQTLVSGYCHNLNLHSLSDSIIDIIFNYLNPNQCMRNLTIAVLFKNNGLQFKPINEDICANMAIYTVHCRSPKYFKKWNCDRHKTMQLKLGYHQISDANNIKYKQLPRAFTSHPLFTRIVGKEGKSNLSVILTSHLSFIVYDGILLKIAMQCGNEAEINMNGIEFQLPNVNNEYDEIKYFKMEYSTKYGLIAFKDNDIYKMDIHSCKVLTDFGINLRWNKLSHFPKQVSISSMCWLSEKHKIFFCGQSAVILDLKNETCVVLDDKLLDEYILFPCALAFNFMFDCVICVGGSNSNKAQMFDLSKSKWIKLQRTIYCHNGQDCAPNIWFDKEHPYFVYVCSYYNDQILCEKLDIRNVKNKWTKCDVLKAYLDFNCWNLHVC